jgi:hypothetical protein
MLHSPLPTILSWGLEMVFLYNDAAISTLTVKHLNALGGLYREVREAWDLVSADLEACTYRGGTAVRTTSSYRSPAMESWRATIGAVLNSCL